MKKWFLPFILCFVISGQASACTLWAIARNTAAGLQIYIGKVRDTIANHTEEIRTVQEKGGISYKGVFAVGEPNNITFSPLKGGTNAAGLTVLFASPSTIPMDVRYHVPFTRDLTHLLLSKYSSIEEVAKDLSKFKGPRLLLLADKNEIAKIEFGLNGEYHIERKTSGTLVMTNHYVALPAENLAKPTESSLSRHLDATEILEKSTHRSFSEIQNEIVTAVKRTKGEILSASFWGAMNSTSEVQSRIEYQTLNEQFRSAVGKRCSAIH